MLWDVLSNSISNKCSRLAKCFTRPKLSLRLGLVSLIAIVSVSLSGCLDYQSRFTNKGTTVKDIKPQPSLVLRVGYDNAVGEPFDLGLRRWKDELEKQSHGTMTLELYPETKLGTQSQIIAMMDQGQNVCTISDGAFYFGKGVHDMGIVFGPYLLKNWDEAFELANSKWYKTQSSQLAKKAGYRIISADWAYGVRHLLTTRPVVSPADFEGLRIRVPNNEIQIKTVEVLGGTPVTVDLAKTRQALREKKVDGLENPLSHLYGGGYYNEAPYLLLTGHVFNFTNLIVSEKWWQTLNPAQKRIMRESCKRAAAYFNVIEEAHEFTVLENLRKAGVTITTPSPALLTELNRRARNFYVLPEFTRKWTPGLYYRALGAKTLKSHTYQR